MVKFADDCMSRMNHILSSLAASLGEDTADLEMRVGLHSGPVTAGVLRGQKSRFQLFGDSVSMANDFGDGKFAADHRLKSRRLFVLVRHPGQHGGANGKQWRTGQNTC